MLLDELPLSYWDYARDKFEDNYLASFSDYWTDYWVVGFFLRNLQERMESAWVVKEVEPHIELLSESLPGCQVCLRIVRVV